MTILVRKNITFFLILFLTACKISLKEEDLTVYNIYMVNDTLVFKNEFGQTKKFAIISKNIINKGWDENTGWYNPQVACIKYKDFSKAKTIYYDNSFLTIYQKTKNEIDETIYFNNFLGSIDRDRQKTKEFSSLYSEQIYKIPKFDITTVRDSNDISYVYWTDKSGIICYEYKNGIKWTLVK